VNDCTLLVAGTPAYCGVAPSYIMMSLLGADGFVKVATAGAQCGRGLHSSTVSST
jgi:hypothetical protein